MKYNILGGVALASVCDENMLVATQKATEKVPAIKKVNETGAFVWRMLEQRKSLEEMAAEAAVKYEIPPEESRAGILDFIKELKNMGYIAQ